ncbi:hypothetical protein, partial [Achromobacter spanius]|uniref:hypothetical protein n=1 Tax=Achromobacter spanius TaxID=217203 RepID=UPI003F69160B
MPPNQMPKEAARAAGFGGPAHFSNPSPASQKHAKHTARPSNRQVSAAQLGVVVGIFGVGVLPSVVLLTF